MTRREDILLSEVLYDAMTAPARGSTHDNGNGNGNGNGGGPVANPPVITSGNAFDRAEGAFGTVFTVTATGGDGPLVYSMSGTDSAFFDMDTEDGHVETLGALDFENPQDDDADNVYELIVGVSDGVNPIVTQAVQVTVTDVAEDGLLAGVVDNQAGYSTADSFGSLEPDTLSVWTIHAVSSEIGSGETVVVMTPPNIAQDAWESVTIDGPGVSSVTLFSGAATTYLADVVAGSVGNATMWVFGEEIEFQDGELYSVSWELP